MTSVSPLPHPDVGALRVSGGSMRPQLQIDDVVLFKRNTCDVAVGSIIVFRDRIHRAVWIQPNVAVWEIGDANAQWPTRRDWSEVEGVVFANVRRGEWESVDPWTPRQVLGGVCRAGIRRWWSRASRWIRR